MGKLSQVYDVTTNIRGLARFGYCRPTVKNFLLGPDDKYAPTWCGGGVPPDWFPEETWDGYPVWPEGLGTQPNYNGPFKPKHPNIPWPGPELGADGVYIGGGESGWVSRFDNTHWAVSGDWGNEAWTGEYWRLPMGVQFLSFYRIDSATWQENFRPIQVRVYGKAFASKTLPEHFNTEHTEVYLDGGSKVDNVDFVSIVDEGNGFWTLTKDLVAWVDLGPEYDIKFLHAKDFEEVHRIEFYVQNGGSGEEESVPGTPSIESISIDGTTATLIVIPPEEGDGGSEILYYTATSNPGGITGTGTMGEENVMIEVTGLTPNTEYTFTVTATNEVGTSDSTEPSDSVLATEVESGNNIAFNVYDTNHETAPIEEGTDWKFLYESSSIKEFDFDYSSYDVAPAELEFTNWPNDTYGCYITKIEFLESGSWVDRTAPANWVVQYDIVWNGSAWAMTGSGKLDGSNTFALSSYRPTKIRLTYSIEPLPLELSSWVNRTSGTNYWTNTTNGQWDGSAWIPSGPPDLNLIVNLGTETWQIDYRPTKARIEFTGVTSIDASIRSQNGGVSYGGGSSISSGSEITLNCTANIGRLYANDSSWSSNLRITKIEFS